jgi:GNAT superfamily N-acetyltransferase
LFFGLGQAWLSVVKVETRRISAEETIPIRWRILRPGFPRETAIFPADDAAETIHFGAFLNDELVGVASLYEAPCPDVPAASRPMQLRGMATLPDVRGAGLGRILLEACVDAALEAGSDWIWCNARRTAVEFYANYGWQIRGPEFDIPTVGPHFRMTLCLPHAVREAV